MQTLFAHAGRQEFALGKARPQLESERRSHLQRQEENYKINRHIEKVKYFSVVMSKKKEKQSHPGGERSMSKLSKATINL